MISLSIEILYSHRFPCSIGQPGVSIPPRHRFRVAFLCLPSPSPFLLSRQEDVSRPAGGFPAGRGIFFVLTSPPSPRLQKDESFDAVSALKLFSFLLFPFYLSVFTFRWTTGSSLSTRRTLISFFLVTEGTIFPLLKPTPLRAVACENPFPFPFPLPRGGGASSAFFLFFFPLRLISHAPPSLWPVFQDQLRKDVSPFSVIFC